MCSDFILIRCRNGNWWDIVALVPCDACDKEMAAEKMQAWCRDAGFDFIDLYDIPDTERELKSIILMSFTMCCDDFNMPAGCAELQIIENAGGFFDNLNECEKFLVAQYPAQAMEFFLNSRTARFETNVRFGQWVGNGCSDAFRHAFWNALNTRDYGTYFAKLFADAHECQADPVTQDGSLEMDLHNNDEGSQYGWAHLYDTPEQIATGICNLMENGDLLILEDPSDDSLETMDSDDCECI